MGNNIFKINWNTAIRWQIFKDIRTDDLVVWVKSLIHPMVVMYNQFLRYRKLVNYRLKITCQLVYLERMLNDQFDYAQRRIVIDDAEYKLPVVLYQEDELITVPLYTEGEGQYQVLYTESEVGINRNIFVVKVPLDLIFSEIRMRALLDYFKHDGVKYTIKRV